MNGLEKREVPAYLGKEIKVYAFKGGGGKLVSERVRGVQNVTTTEERPETRISEMGSDATAVIYASANYSAAITLMGRDLYMLAKMTGVNPDTEATIGLSDFGKINIVQHFEEPNTDTVLFSKLISGWQSRTSSSPTVTDGAATISLDGGADLIREVEGRNEIEEFRGSEAEAGDGITYTLAGVPTCVTLVETPAGAVYSKLSKEGENWVLENVTVVLATKKVSLVTPASPNDVVRIAYRVD